MIYRKNAVKLYRTFMVDYLFGFCGGSHVGKSDDSVLRADDIPAPDAPWDAIWAFALTFNGYRHCGSFEKCAEIANEKRDATLADLRTCLFFERQRWHHYGDEPDVESEPYIRGLVSKIRNRVLAADP